MERRIFFLCLLSFLMFADGVSWFTAGGLGPCLIEPEHSKQAADDNEHHDCPTFFAGTLLSFERGFDWIKRDDNDKAVVAAFTIVLAISTIGLWLATINLWQAGERQLEILSESSAAQSRDMQASIAAAQMSAKAAQATADAIQITERPYIFIWGVSASSSQDDAVFRYSISNRGKLAAVVERVSIACGYEKGGQFPPPRIAGDHEILQSPIISSERDENFSHRVSWRDLDWGNPIPGFRNGLIFRVVVLYRGPITKAHTTSQCWRYVRAVNGATGFEEVSDEGYTYSQ